MNMRGRFAFGIVAFIALAASLILVGGSAIAEEDLPDFADLGDVMPPPQAATPDDPVVTPQPKNSPNDPPPTPVRDLPSNAQGGTPSNSDTPSNAGSPSANSGPTGRSSLSRAVDSYAPPYAMTPCGTEITYILNGEEVTEPWNMDCLDSSAPRVTGLSATRDDSGEMLVRFNGHSTDSIGRYVYYTSEQSGTYWVNAGASTNEFYCHPGVCHRLPGTSYTLYVQALTSGYHRYGPPASVRITNPRQRPSWNGLWMGEPEVNGSTSVRLYFGYLSFDGSGMEGGTPITQFQVRWRLETDTDNRFQYRTITNFEPYDSGPNSQGLAGTYLVTGLEPNTEYIFDVRARNSVGWTWLEGITSGTAEWYSDCQFKSSSQGSVACRSVLQSATTNNAGPAAPVLSESLSTTHNKMGLSWTIEDPDGIVDGYEIQVSSDGQFGWKRLPWVTTYPDDQNRQVTCYCTYVEAMGYVYPDDSVSGTPRNRPEPESTLYFRVRGYELDGRTVLNVGEWSNILGVTTAAAPPEDEEE